jgi:hypothetical protein
MVLTDLDRLMPYRRALAWGAVLVAAVAMVYGTLTILAFQPPAGVTLAGP